METLHKLPYVIRLILALGFGVGWVIISPEFRFGLNLFGVDVDLLISAALLAGIYFLLLHKKKTNQE